MVEEAWRRRFFVSVTTSGLRVSEFALTRLWHRNYKHPEFKKQLDDATEGFVDAYFDKYVFVGF